ncbi:hypothetical protein H4S06_001109 [Coemansia sp. BCRC 34490]|nr:hypothetical protein H4S06_001109 [Coemansia sp. BCRC 34490]
MMTVDETTVKPGTVFELCEMENSMVPYPVLQYSLVYRTSEQETQRNTDVVKILKDSFNRLTQLYPIVLGHKERIDNKNVIVVSREDLLEQRVFVHEESDISSEDFELVRCRRDLWPADVDRLLKERTADTSSLISAVVVCFKNGSGYLLSLSMSHIVADVSGMLILLEQWASIARKMIAARIADDGKYAESEIMPDRAIDFGHARFWEKLSAHPKDDHPHITYVERQDCSCDGDIGRLAKWAKEYYGSGAHNGDRTNLELRVLHVSSQSIEKMRLGFNTDSGGKRPLHGIQIFYALFWQRYVAKCLQLRNADIDHSQPVFLNIIHNVRGLTPAPDYVGNAVSPVYVRTTVGELLENPVIETANLIKSHINSITPGATVQCAEAVNNPSNPFVPKLMYLQRHQESGLVISNASRFPFFDLDFGIGKATGVHCGKLAVEGMSSWVPHSDGGVELYFGAKDGICTLLKDDPVFAEYVEFSN